MLCKRLILVRSLIELLIPVALHGIVVHAVEVVGAHYNLVTTLVDVLMVSPVRVYSAFRSDLASLILRWL